MTDPKSEDLCSKEHEKKMLWGSFREQSGWLSGSPALSRVRNHIRVLDKNYEATRFLPSISLDLGGRTSDLASSDATSCVSSSSDLFPYKTLQNPGRRVHYHPSDLISLLGKANIHQCSFRASPRRTRRYRCGWKLSDANPFGAWPPRRTALTMSRIGDA